jgi:intracellular sulfur oxidation DsrE/DsrF family protein
MEKYRVVVHIDESARSRGNLALKNIENLFANLGEECANSLRQMGLTQEALLELVEVVPAG